MYISILDGKIILCIQKTDNNCLHNYKVAIRTRLPLIHKNMMIDDHCH